MAGVFTGSLYSLINTGEINNKSFSLLLKLYVMEFILCY